MSSGEKDPSTVADWKTFLLGTGKFTEESDKTVFEALAKKKTLPAELIASPDITWESFLVKAGVEDDDDRRSIVFGLNKLKAPPPALQLGPSSGTKSFAHGATVNLESNFFVPRESLADYVVHSILQRSHFVTLRGGSQSGKSTLALSIMLRFGGEFTFLYLNLAGGGYIPNFWEGLAMKLNELGIIENTVLTQIAFLSLLKKENLATKFGNKRVVIIIDELALALAEAAKTNSPTTEFFNSIREIKVRYNDFCVEAVMAIGVFGTLSTERDELSPLRLLTDIVRTIPFSFEELLALFAQYAKQTRKEIETEVLEDIFSVTLGHTGFVGYLGHVIEVIFVSKSLITYADWRNYFVWDLDIRATDVGLAVIEYFKKYPDHAEYLRDTLLLTSQFQLANTRDIPIVDTLMKAAIVSEVWISPAANVENMDTTDSTPPPSGALSDRELPKDLVKEIDEFNNLPPLDLAQTVVATPAPTLHSKKVIQFSSPIMRSLVMQILAPPHRPISEVLFEHWLDFVTLVVPLMDISQLKKSKLFLSTKFVNNSYLPSEHAYHYEYHSKLNWLLPQQLGAQPQVGGSQFKMGNNRLDMVINSILSVGIELSAHTTLADNQAHADRFQKEYKALKLRYCGIIHFTSNKDSIAEFPKLLDGQHFTHIYHNHNFSEICAVDSSGISLALQQGNPFVLRGENRITPPELAPHLRKV